MSVVGESDSRAPRRNRTPALVLKNLQRSVKFSDGSFRQFLRHLADELAPGGTSATLVLVGDERMRTLNRRFRGLDRATDVLSFPADPEDVPADSEDAAYLGDIVISVDTARRQARRRGSTLRRELRVLALHGLLHLLGHDHETDNGEMRRIEYRLRRKLQIIRRRGAR